jgi:hypothetical protein
MVSGELNPDAVALEPIMGFPQLLLASLDLQGRVRKTGTPHGLIVGTLMTAMS